LLGELSSFKKIQALLLLFVAFGGMSVFARRVSRESYSDCYMQDFFFEISRFCITKKTDIPEASDYAALSRYPVRLLSRRMYKPGHKKAIFLFEYICPSKIGVIDADIIKKDKKLAVNKPLETDFDNESVDFCTAEVPDFLNYFYYQDSGLRRHLFEGEQSVYYNEGDKKIIVNNYGSNIIKRIFDNNFRLLEVQRFELGETSRDLSPVSVREYFYSTGDGFPSRAVEENEPKSTRTEIFYSELGYEIQKDEFHYEVNNTEAETEKKELVHDKRSEWTRNKNGRVLSETFTTWYYKEGSKKKRKVSVNVVKNVYDYKGKGSEPDVLSYENGSLYMKKIYTSSSSWTETIFFEGGMSIRTDYKNGVKMLEIVYSDGKEIRRKTFEN